MIRLSTYLSKEKQANYINPVTGENWTQEQKRLKKRRADNIRNNGFEYIGCVIKILFGFIPIAVIAYLVSQGL
ncbi:MAG: hypothetical protein IJM28_06985 [Lachnospiraceae bacterium]|nr:hypothetical protein [Lachnospiraceae bacterium]